ncbi:MAG: tetratricopeptide repeat protein [Rickettsiales bacterium]|nr:tetratricopeptide repeat protein [Rickettsiales bacterium]
MDKNKKNIHELRGYMVPLLAGVALCAISSTTVYADDAEPEVVPAYKISDQTSGASPYLKDSPYVARNRKLEAQKIAPIRRRPMRFSKGGALPAAPKFDDGFGEPLVTVGDAVPAVLEPLQPAELDPVLEKSIGAGIPSVETQVVPIALPSEIDDVEMRNVEMVAPLEIEQPVDDMAEFVEEIHPVEMEVPFEGEFSAEVVPAMVAEPTVTVQAAEVEGGVPESFMDTILSVFDSEKEPEVKADIAMPEGLRVKPIVNPNPSAPMMVRPKATGLGAPLKTIVIERAPEEHSSIERTRQIIIPPEIQKIEREERMAHAGVPPLVLMRERFQENLINVPPVSNLASISKEVAKPMAAKIPVAAAVEELPEVAAIVEQLEEVATQLPEELPVEALAVASVEMPSEKPTTILAQEVVPVVEQAPMPVMSEEMAAIEPIVEEVASSSIAAVVQEIVEEPAAVIAEPVAVVAGTVEASEPVAVVTKALEVTESVQEMAAKQAPVPVKSEVIMQKLPGAHKSIAKLSDANVVIEEAKQVELAKESKMMLRNFPSGLNAPQVKMVDEKVEISRATVPDLEISKPLIRKHEALGISIEIKKPDLNVNDYLVMAYEAMQGERFSLASQYYQAILDNDASHEDAILGLATVSHRLGDNDTARALYRKLLMSSPRNTAVLNNFLVLVSEEAPEKALRELLDLESKNPHYDVLPAQLATIYANQGDMENAIEKIARAIELNPEHLLYRYNLAVMLDHAGQKNEAIQVYSAVKSAIEKGDKIPTDISHIQERLTFLLSNQSS